MTDPFYCSQQSLEANEQLFGTVPRVDTWFLLEYNGRWEPEAVEDSDLPEPVKHALLAQHDALPHARVGFIRRQSCDESARGLAFYIALIREARPALYALRLETYDDLLAWDLPGICAEDPIYDQFKQSQPLLIVCTHGRRDKCCARIGRPVYERLSEQTGGDVWQSSHVGGHRFAANMITLPTGIYYGRVQPDSVAEVARPDQIALDHYRGRSCYDKPVQAAEYYLRTQTGITDPNAFRLAGAERTDSGEWIVRFVATAGGASYTLRMSTSQIETLSNCTDTAPSTVTQYHLLPG